MPIMLSAWLPFKYASYFTREMPATSTIQEEVFRTATTADWNTALALNMHPFLHGVLSNRLHTCELEL